MSEPFTYRRSPILIPDIEPRRAWPHAPHVGAKTPDAPCTIFDGSTPRRTWLRHLLGTEFLALYFTQNEATSRQFTQEVLPRQPLNLTLWPVLSDVPHTSLGLPAIWDHTGQLTDAFTAQPGTL